MSVANVAGGTLLAQAANLMSTQTSMLRMSVEADQAMADLLDRNSGQAQAPSQAVTPAAAPGKGAVVDILA
ncbi:hypothetical protein [Roseospira goensis]|uniref:Motility protein n=1 Tax=Roseospira goensis TaxID=391922 RepID=A0A7W6WLB7_9PROT|nr:hypothetical protein [Roseospira goensis]MBB4286543.1 hypothetical protein [Roseospira goensis]